VVQEHALVGIPSKEFEVWRRLYARFLLEPMPAEGSQAWVSPVITPVTDADDLLATPRIDSEAKDIQAAAGVYVPYFTVPTGRRWLLKGLRKPATTAITRVLLRDTINGVNLDMSADQTAGENVLRLAVKMPAAWSIGLVTTGNAGDSNRTMTIMYEEQRDF